MIAELIIGISPETLELLNKIALETMHGDSHTPLDRFAALILKGINEDIECDLPDGVGTTVHIVNRVTDGFN